jgi:hypothetical protein
VAGEEPALTASTAITDAGEKDGRRAAWQFEEIRSAQMMQTMPRQETTGPGTSRRTQGAGCRTYRLV